MNIIQKDVRLLIILLAVSFVSVYFLPTAFNRIIFLILLFTAYRTKLDYVYLVWFFIINDAPGRLFSAGEFAEAARIPLYPVIPGVSIGFQDLFILLYIIKYLRLQPRPQFIFHNAFLWFYVISLLFVIYSFFIGMDFSNIVRTFRSLLPWCLVFIVPAFISDRQTLVRSGLMLFPFVLFSFASLIFTYISGYYLDHYLRGFDPRRTMELEEGRFSRSYSAFYIILTSIMLALYFSLSRKIMVNKSYLYTIIFIGYLIIILSGIRGWIIAVGLLLLGTIFLSIIAGQIIGFIRMAAVTAVVFLIVITLYPGVQEQIQLSFKRVATVGAIARGDVTAEGTLGRIDIRTPRVMNKFRENPILGWGFSDVYYEYQDGHVAHPNLLLSNGIIGYVYLNVLFFYICFIIWILARNRLVMEHEGNALLIFVLGLLAVFIMHSTSGQFWGYTIQMHRVLFFAYFFAAVNTIYLNYVNND